MNDAGVLSPSKSSRPGQHLLLVISQFVSSNSALHKLGSLSILYICDNVMVLRQKTIDVAAENEFHTAAQE